jgi:K+-transporting ATPase ATPase C chain
MASGSGLDPHITLANAHYQMDRIVDAWAAKTKKDKDTVRGIIDRILKEQQEAPLGGLAGVPLINVLEVNLALDQQLRQPVAAAR